nr:hypothetical protein [Tanacetum cinerariifolium]
MSYGTLHSRPKTYEELSDKEKLLADYDLKATNIVLQGLPPDVYALINHHKISKDIWDRVKLLMQVQGRQGQLVIGLGSQRNASDAHDSNCDDISSAKAVLMANLLSCDSEILSKVPYSNTFKNDMMNQSVQELQYSEQSPIVDYPDDEIKSDSNTIPYS